MEIIQAEYTIVTPMFLGGADKEPTDGIRPPSVKGALRFWWRALNWGRFWQENNQNETEALKALHREEARLFGAAVSSDANNDGHHGGQGCFLLSVTSRHLTTQKKNTIHQKFSARANDAARYLGYGVMEAFSSKTTGKKAGQLTRGCINENQHFIVKLAFKKTIEPSIKEALMALGLLGGLGSRVRRGLGSLSLERLSINNDHIWHKPTNEQTYKAAISELLSNKLIASNPAPYSCFDEKSRVDQLNEASTPYAALSQLGEAMMMYRSWGKGEKGREVLGQPREERFKMDHDWSNEMPNIPRNFHPKRAVFGLPHNYKKLSVTAEYYERRSSPLLLHIHQLNKDSFLTVSLLLRSVFLPDKVEIKAGNKLVENQTRYSTIIQFLEGNKKAEGTPRFNKTSLIKGAKA